MNNMDEPLIATGGYDHTIKLFQPYSGVCFKTLQVIIKMQNEINFESKHFPFILAHRLPS